LLSVYYYALLSGNATFVREQLPAVERVIGYMLSLGLASDGIAIIPNASYDPFSQKSTRNLWISCA
jgi:hypothetical protein